MWSVVVGVATNWLSELGLPIADRLLDPKGTALDRALGKACGRADEEFGTHYGDALSSQFVGKPDLPALMTLFALAVNIGEEAGLADQMVAAAPEFFDPDVIGLEPVAYLVCLARFVEEELKAAAQEPKSPLANWYNVVRHDCQPLQTKRLLLELSASASATAALLPGAAVPALGAAGRIDNTKRRPGRYFYGRDTVLQRVHESLQGEGARLALTAVAGMGGVGKTTVAAAYVERHGAEYDIVWWLSAANDQSDERELLPGLADLAAALGVANPDDEIATRATAALRQLNIEQRRWLLIYDNVPSETDVIDWLPASGRGAVLITTRSQRVDQLADRIDVGSFDQSTGEAFLRRRVAEANPVAAAEAAVPGVVRVLGGLPLALEQAGAYVAGLKSRRFSEYLTRLEEDLVGALSAAPLPADYPVPAYLTARSSIAAANGENPIAGRVLLVCSFLDPDAPIPMSLLRLLATDSELGASPWQIDDAVATLVAYSLLTDGDDGVYVHRLTQTAARHATVELLEWAWSAAAAALLGVVTNGLDPAAWPACRQVVPHALVALAQEPEGSDAETAWLLANWTATAIQHWGDPVRSTTHFEHARDLAEAHLGSEHPDTLTAWANLANSYRSAGRTADAITIEERVADQCERILGSEHPDTLTALSNLANSYWSAGRTGEAITIEERVADQSEQILGSEHPDTLTAWSNLASSYWSAGRTGEAITIEERVADQSEQILGPEHPDSLRAWANLAVSYMTGGRTGEAITILERVARQRETILGSEHPRTLSAWANLASSYRAAGRPDEAFTIFERVAGQSEQILGPEHPDTLTAWGNLAASYRATGRQAEAITIEERVADQIERVLGSEHPDTLTAWSNLAGSYWSAGRAGEAITIRERVANEIERVLGSEHSNTSKAWANLATSYWSAGRTTDAIRSLQYAVSGLEKRLDGSAHGLDAMRRALEEWRAEASERS